jgi:hypothetical protein
MTLGTNALLGGEASAAASDVSIVPGADAGSSVSALPGRWWCSIDLERAESAGALRIVVHGVLDDVSLPVLRERLASAASVAELVEVDLAGVTFASIEVALLLLGAQSVPVALVGASRSVERAFVAARGMIATRESAGRGAVGSLGTR